MMTRAVFGSESDVSCIWGWRKLDASHRFMFENRQAAAGLHFGVKGAAAAATASASGGHDLSPLLLLLLFRPFIRL